MQPRPWHRGAGQRACCLQGALPRGQGCEGVCVCGPRPSRRLAWSCLPLHPAPCSPKCPPPGCSHLPPLRPSSGALPLGSLSWLPAVPTGRSPRVELGVGTSPHAAGAWVLSWALGPLQPRPWHRAAGSCAEASGRRSLARRPLGGPGVPSRGGWFEALAGPPRSPV